MSNDEMAAEIERLKAENLALQQRLDEFVASSFDIDHEKILAEIGKRRPTFSEFLSQLEERVMRENDQ